MKIFLTGATGFIGSHVLAHLASLPHEITALQRPGSNPCLSSQHIPIWLEKPMDEVSQQDLVGVEVLIHMASVGVSPKEASWQDLFYWNVGATLRLLESAKEAGVRRIVMAGSFAEYGRSADRYEFIPVDAPLIPTSAYAASKAAGYIASSTFAIVNQIELCYLRIFSAFGEGQFAGNFWPALREAAQAGRDFPMSLGEQIRDYIPVEAVATAILRGALQDEMHPGHPLVLNVGSGVPVSMRQFAEYWWNHWEAPGRLQLGAMPYRKNEPMRFVPFIETQP